MWSPPGWTTPNSFAYPGATSSISANGSANGIVWASENTNPAILHAYDAGDLHPLYDSNQAAASRDHFGAGNKFITPMIANGKVYVGTTNGVGCSVFYPPTYHAVRQSATARQHRQSSLSDHMQPSQLQRIAAARRTQSERDDGPDQHCFLTPGTPMSPWRNQHERHGTATLRNYRSRQEAVGQAHGLSGRPAF